MLTHCPVCERTHFNEILHLPTAPVHCNRLWPSRAAALAAPVGEIELVHCQHCDHIFNHAFDENRIAYDPDYENSLFHSARFRDYAQNMAGQLIQRHNLRDKTLLEIGCGGGDFLKLICELSQSAGWGFDPAYDPQQGIPPGERLHFERGYFTAAQLDTPADFVICRHVLEHLVAPAELLALTRKLAAPLFFEVPNALYTLRDLGIWDVIYEHPSYFTPASLGHIFERNGYTITRLREVYGRQFLAVEAHPARKTSGAYAAPSASRIAQDRKAPLSHQKLAKPRRSEIGDLVAAFKARRAEKVAHWEGEMRRFTASGQQIVLWGAGSKGVTFLNSFQRELPVEHIVDINPRKQGLYIPRTGQKIIAPGTLKQIQPAGIILLNPLYEAEIRAQVAALGVQAKIYVA